MKRFRLLYILLSFFVIFEIVFILQKEKTEFDLKKISSPFDVNTKWIPVNISEIEMANIREVLSQEYHYLGSGAECYAFSSADGKYVLKFFKMKHLLPKNWLKMIPLPILKKYKFRKIDRRILRQQELFSGYKLAFEELKEQTGLIYIHLNKTKDLQIKTHLYDRMSKRFPINLDDYEFILQKKSQPIRDKIISLMQKGNREAVLESMCNLFRLIILQCQKGFVDLDSGVCHNYGFVKDQVIHFDVGRLVQDELAQDPTCYQREVLRVGEKLENWLQLEFPTLLPDLEEAINAVMDPSFQT